LNISVQAANLSDCWIESKKIDSAATNRIETFLPELECSSKLSYRCCQQAQPSTTTSFVDDTIDFDLSSRLETIKACDRRTHNDSKYHTSIVSHSKNEHICKQISYHHDTLNNLFWPPCFLFWKISIYIFLLLLHGILSWPAVSFWAHIEKYRIVWYNIIYIIWRDNKCEYITSETVSSSHNIFTFCHCLELTSCKTSRLCP